MTAHEGADMSQPVLFQRFLGLFLAVVVALASPEMTAAAPSADEQFEALGER